MVGVPTWLRQALYQGGRELMNATSDISDIIYGTYTGRVRPGEGGDWQLVRTYMTKHMKAHINSMISDQKS